MLVRGLESLWWYAWIHFAIGGLHWISTYFRPLSVLKADHIPPLWLLQLVEMSREQEMSVAFPIRQCVKRQRHHLRNEGLQTDQEEKHMALFASSDEGIIIALESFDTSTLADVESSQNSIYSFANLRCSSERYWGPWEHLGMLL